MTMRQIQLLFGIADRRITRLQHGEIESLLVAEIMIEHTLVGLRPRRDRIHPGAAETMRGKFFRRRVKIVAWVRCGLRDAFLDRLPAALSASACALFSVSCLALAAMDDLLPKGSISDGCGRFRHASF